MAKFELKIKNRMDKLFIVDGYVLDFSNNSFQNFVLESVDEDIYDEKYSEFGDSKGNRLRGFWKNASIDKIIQLSLDLLDYWENITNEGDGSDLKSYEICKSYFEKLITKKNDFVGVSFENRLNEDILSHKFIKEQIDKSHKKIKDDDYSGAITNSRALIEQVLKELSNKLDMKIDAKGNLPKLYKEVSKKLNFEIKENSLESVKKIVSGLITIIDGISTLRNEASDAHGREINPSKHTGVLAVNISFTICQFLLDSYKDKIKS